MRASGSSEASASRVSSEGMKLIDTTGVAGRSSSTSRCRLAKVITSSADAVCMQQRRVAPQRIDRDRIDDGARPRDGRR